MFDWTAHLRETAHWLVQMAHTPGWQEHAKQRRDALLAEPMYGKALREAILEALVAQNK